MGDAADGVGGERICELPRQIPNPLCSYAWAEVKTGKSEQFNLR
jgi:hypothetical protein